MTNNAERSIVMCGLPSSGKSTYLAALWHLVSSRELETTLRFESLRRGDFSHLNSLAARWRAGEAQEHTPSGSLNLVSMNLVDAESAPTCVTFPDLSGELYQLMWEKREYERDFAELLSTGAGLLLFVHSDTIVAPQWIVDVVAQCKQIGIPVPEESKISWHPRLAPTQVQIVDLLQLMQASPLDMPSGKLAVMMSAWDKAAPEGRTPKEYLNERMPLLGQYLFGNWDESDCRIYGVSAFGGDPETKKAELLGLDKQSERIRLVHDTDESHDLTEPIAWLGI